MRKPYTINFNDRNDEEYAILIAVRQLAYDTRQSISKTLMRLVAKGLQVPDAEVVAQPDPVDSLVQMIADLQYQMQSMDNRIRELSARPVVTVSPGTPQPIDAIGESIVYDSAPDQVARPITEEFKKHIISVAQSRKGMGVASSQLEAPDEARRGS